MAKRDVVQYYLEQEATYSQMLEDVNDLEKSYKSGNMDYDRYAQLRDSLTEDIQAIKEEYERLSYVMFLLNMPNRVEKKDRYKRENQAYFAYLEKYSKEKLVDDSKDILAKFKEQIRKYNEENK